MVGGGLAPRRCRRRVALCGTGLDSWPGGGAPDWDDGNSLAFFIDGDRRNTGGPADDDDLYLIVNGSPEARTFRPPERSGRPWRLAWSTMEAEPRIEDSENGLLIRVEGRSVTALNAPMPNASIPK